MIAACLCGPVWLLLYHLATRFGASGRLPELAAGLISALGLALWLALSQAARARRAEARSAAAAADLRSLNAVLFAEIEVRRAAESAAREAGQARVRLLATVSHEVRTPLNALEGLFELILRSDDPADIRNKARAGAETARGLFHDLSNVLDTTRIEEGKLDVIPERTALRPLVSNWEARLSGMIARSGKPLRSAVLLAADLEHAALHTDGARLTQIVTNLCDNAVKFTERGTVALRIGTETDGGLAIRVIDTGPGLPERARDDVFRRYFQLPGADHSRPHGAGLGLALCRDLAAMLGGTVDVESSRTAEAGGAATGTVFRILLPGTCLQPAAAEVSAPPPRAHGRPRCGTARARSTCERAA